MTKALVPIIVLVLAVAVLATVSPYCMTGVELAVVPEEKVFSKGDPVRFHVVLTNRIQTVEKIAVVPDDFPFEFQLEKLLPNGCWKNLGGKIPARGQKSRSLLVGNPEWHSIEPGQSYMQEVDVTDFLAEVTKKEPSSSKTYVVGAVTCDKSVAKPELVGKGTIYRIEFRHDGVRATDIMGNKPGEFGCTTKPVYAQFAVRNR
jgi:hypothetical protein